MWSVQGILMVLRVGGPMEKLGGTGRTFSSLTGSLGTLESHPGPSAGTVDTQKQSEKMGRDVTERSGCRYTDSSSWIWGLPAGRQAGPTEEPGPSSVHLAVGPRLSPSGPPTEGGEGLKEQDA